MNIAQISTSMNVTTLERWRSVIGAMLGILITFLLGQWSAHWAQPWEMAVALAAPMGATAIILFALPSSPLAQPWAVLGGNTLSALTGVAVVHLVPDPQWAAGLAVGAAMTVMFAAHCLHPPGGAVALLAVLTHTTNPLYALAPVLLNSIVLVAAAAIYNTRTGRPYPHSAAPVLREGPVHGPRFSAADLDAALARYNEVMDIDRDDLEALLHEAEAKAWERTLGQMRCHEIMSRDPITVHKDDSLQLAWEHLNHHSIKALPVVDEGGHLVGIVTMADLFARLASGTTTTLDQPAAPTGSIDSVETVMTHHVRVATDTARVLDLLPLFSEGGHHHLPVIDSDKVLVGMITQSDVIRALHRNLG